MLGLGQTGLAFTLIFEIGSGGAPNQYSFQYYARQPTLPGQPQMLSGLPARGSLPQG